MPQHGSRGNMTSFASNFFLEFDNVEKTHFLAIFFWTHFGGGITTFVLLANHNQLRNQQWQSGSFSSINKPSSSFLSKA